MTIETPVVRISHTITNAGPYSVPFLVINGEHLLVYDKNPSSGESATRLAINADYYVTGTDDENGALLYLTDVSYRVGHTLIIINDPPILQPTDYPEVGKFPAKSHERALDLLTIIALRLADRVSRAVATPDGEVGVGNTIFPAPMDQWLLGWEGSDLVNFNPSSLNIVNPFKPVGGGDAVWLTGWTEFSFATWPVCDDGKKAHNAILDQQVRAVSKSVWESDFIHVIRDELARTLVRKVVIWYNWFSYKDALNSLTPRISYTPSLYLWTDPDIYTIDCSAIGGPKWNIDGQDGGTPIPVGPNIGQQPGGTVCDGAILQGIKELVDRGYEVGICPVAIFYDPTKFATGDFFYWRGLATWPDLATFNQWLVGYAMMHRHTMELYEAANAKPWIVYIGSEMRWLSAEAPADIMSAWYLTMQDLADEWKAKFPDCKITYSASDHEVGYFGGTFAMDALWSHPHTDHVGYSWYKPLAVRHTNDYGVLRAGVLAGERIDYRTDYESLESGRWLSAGTGTGKSSVPLYRFDPKKSWQNGVAQCKLAHYSDKIPGVAVHTSPLPGHNDVMTDGISSNPLILPHLSGTAILARAQDAHVNLGPGLAPLPPDTDHFLYCDGTTYMSAAMPVVVNYPITSYRIKMKFKHLSALANWARLIQINNPGPVIIGGVFIDNTNPNAVVVALHVVDSVGDNFYQFATVDEASPSVVELDAMITADSVTVNGTVNALANPAIMPAAQAVVVLGSAAAGYGHDECEIYYAMFEGMSDTPNRKYGGQWFFEDEYAGIRSSWVPGSKSPIAAELGFASVNGSCVEPNVFTEVKYGPGTLPSPLWFTDRPYWMGKGIEDIYGPYGSTFGRDEYHQAICLMAAVDVLAKNGFEHQVIYNIDSRPSKAMLAVDGAGNYYFGDAIKFPVSHSINGKVACGNATDDPIAYGITNPTPDQLTTTGTTRIFFVRHADTAVDGNNNYIRDFTANGDAQVAALPAKLAAASPGFKDVIVSPLWRSINTILPWLISNGRTAEIWPENTETSWDAVGIAVVPEIEGGILPQMSYINNIHLRDRVYGTVSADIPYGNRIFAPTPVAGFEAVSFVNDLLRGKYSGKGVDILVICHYHTGSRIIDMLMGGSQAQYDPTNPPYQLTNGAVTMLFENGANYLMGMYNDEQMYTGSLVGSNWVHIGDSISTKRFWVGWPKQYEPRSGDLERRMNWTLIENCSDGGRTAHDGTYLGTWLWCMQEAINVNYTNVDIVTILVGTNDWGGHGQLGLITDPASKDAYSFFANYRYILEWLHTQKPTLKIVCFTPLQRTYGGFLGSLPDPITGATLLDFVDAIKALQVEYSGLGYDIHVIDLYNGNVLTEATEPYPGPYTYTYDGLHPKWNTPGETDCITLPVVDWFMVNYP